MKRWMDAGMVLGCSALLFTAACTKKEEAKPEGVASAKAVAAASAAPSAAPAPTAAAGYTKGDAAKYTLAECKGGRIYVDTAALLSLAGDAAKGLEDKVTAAAGGAEAEKAKKILQTFKDGGFDPTTGIKEVAACIIDDKAGPVLAIGVDLTKVKGDPLDLILKSAEVAGEKKPVKKTEGKLSYLLLDGEEGALAVFGNVIVLGQDLAKLQEAAKAGGAAGFKDASGTVVYAFVPGPQGDITASLTETAEELKLVGTMKGEQIKAKGEALVTQSKGMLDEVVKGLAATPFKDLAEPLKGLKVSVADDTVKAELAIPKKTVQGAIKTAQDMKPEDFMKLLK